MYILATNQASNFVSGVDRAFIIILSISLFFLIGLTLTMVYFVYRYNKKRNPVATQIKGSNTLEIVWTVIPVALVMIMFYYGWAGWKPMKTAPDDSFEIDVVARMWNFTFHYDNGRQTDTLFVPQNQAVKLNLVSMDVIHSLYIPSFRVKEDVVPGREKFTWFIPEQEGTYELFCAEYCGLQHSYMYNWVKVMPQEEFESWYTDTTLQVAEAVDTPVSTGRRIMTNVGCFACHTIDGSKLVGPSFKGIYGSTVTVQEGRETKELVVNDDYITQSILDPNSQITEGFNRGLMQPYTGQLDDEDIASIIEYLKTLQ